MNLETALQARDRIAAFLNVDGQRRRSSRPRVAIGIGPSESTIFAVAIRAPSEKDLARALGEGIAEQVHAMAAYEIDIQITGEIFVTPPSTAAATPAPLTIGASVGHYNATAGSLGFFAQSLVDSSIGFVSNNHVLANCDNGKDGDDILHPAPSDHGKRATDVVANLAGGYPRLQRNGTIVDAAFARLRDGVDHDTTSIGPSLRLQPTLVPLFRQRQVFKFGRSSGFTRGRITAFALQNLSVDYSPGSRIAFDRQIEITSEADAPFSQPGDSGSLVVNPDGHPVGLLFAGSRDGRYSYANPIADVMRELDVRLLA